MVFFDGALLNSCKKQVACLEYLECSYSSPWTTFIIPLKTGLSIPSFLVSGQTCMIGFYKTSHQRMSFIKPPLQAEAVLQICSIVFILDILQTAHRDQRVYPFNCLFLYQKQHAYVMGKARTNMHIILAATLKKYIYTLFCI